MVFPEVFERFIEDSPVSVMFRGTLENVFAAERLDQMFEEAAQRQYCGELLFSTCADLMGLVVAKIRKSVHAAYRTRAERISVSVKAVYDKLAGIEPAVSERMVRDTASDLAAIIREMKVELPGPLAGYDVRIVDGNHLAGTDHRIKELRTLGAAPLPGQAVAILNPQVQLIEDVVTCEDGHANERTLIPQLLEKVCRGQCWIADRNFCTLLFFFGIVERGGYFIIRHHGQIHGELIGRRKKVGAINTGVVYEQQMRVTHRDGRELVVRRITIKLKKPTRDGETEIHILTNLPLRVGARKIAELYSSRWNIETAFQELATSLRGEINTLGYPDAALFGFCVALVTYNALSTVRAALRAAAGRKKLERKLSAYYLADEISSVYRGMVIAIPTEYWTETFADLSACQMAKRLICLAKKVNLHLFYTNPYTPKKPPPKRKSGNRGNHVSTYRILQQRAAAK